VKIRSSLQAKARRGEYLGSCDPYGYLRNPKDKHRLVINPETAPIVKRIFELCASGYSLKKIADIYNSEGILCPADYDDFRNHDPQAGEFKPKYNKWHQATVRFILVNPMFAGHMVQCRKRSLSYRTQKIVLNAKEDWIIVKNTHEPIVSEDFFNQVQATLKGRARPIKSTGEPHIFTKLFFCAECGRTMAHHKKDKGDYFSCGKYRAEGLDGCSSHFIFYNHVYEIVLQDIQRNVEILQSDEETAVKDIMKAKNANVETMLATSKKELAKAQKQQIETIGKIKKMYEDNMTGKLPDDLFATFLQDYENEKNALNNSVKSLEREIVSLEGKKIDVSHFINAVKKYTSVEKLDRQILTELVEKITVSEDKGTFGRNRKQTLTIYYKFVGAL